MNEPTLHEISQRLHSCRPLLTTEPNAPMRPLHHRLPVILHPGAYSLWLDPAIQDPDRPQPLLRQYPPDPMMAYPVSARVNNPGYDGPACIEPSREEK